MGNGPDGRPQGEGGSRPTGTTVLVAAACLLLLAGLVALRHTTGVEVELADLALPVLVFGLYLFITGRVTKIEAGGVTLERALSRAHGTSVDATVTEVSSLPVDRVDYWQKGGPATLDRILEEGGEALSFQFGRGGYRGEAVEEYLDQLVAAGTIRWVLFLAEDSSFWGMVEAKHLGRLLGRELSARTLANALNAGDREPLLEHLDGLIPAEAALAPGTEKRAALEAMEERSVDVLPVLDEEGRFRGVAERSRLVASILLEVDRTIESRGESPAEERR